MHNAHNSLICCMLCIGNAVQNCQTDLKLIYNNLPNISTQSLIDNSVEKQFINITLLKSLENNEHNMKDYCHSPEHMIKDEVVYGSYPYVNYDEIFQVSNDNCNTYQLFLLEGDAGTGKTSLAYKVCKFWAEGKVLQKYSCIF